MHRRKDEVLPPRLWPSIQWALALLAMLVAGATAGATRGVVLDVAGEDVRLYDSSYALLVGNSDYSAGWPDLESVPRELDQVEHALADQGFQVEKRLNLDAGALKNAFEEFIAAHGYEPGNRLMFFYSGHGHTWNETGQGYLVPADAPLPASVSGNPGPEFLRKALHMSQVLAWSRQMTAKHALFLFDSCFSGTIFKTKSLPGQPPHITRATALKVRQFITAGSAGEEVPARSVFTPAFVDALELGWGDLNNDGYITGVELGLYLQTKVPQHARQSPQFGKHPDYELSRGDFVLEARPALAAIPRSVAPVVPPPPPPVQFSGNVQVNVNVPATVYLGGRKVGDAQPGRPLNRQGLDTGPLLVRVEAKGYQPAEQQVQVRRGQWEQIIFELERAVKMASLTVRSNVYGDRVYIDGVARGSTRLDVDLAPGVHAVRVEKDGYSSFEQQLRLEAGATVMVRARLNPIRPAPPSVPKERPGGPEVERQAKLQAACERECLRTKELCKKDVIAASEADPQRCRDEAAVRCEDVYGQCRGTRTIVGGEVSVDSECSGEQYRCERDYLAKCKRNVKLASPRCDDQANDCLLACRH